MEQQRIMYIIKATATKLSRPDYFAAADETQLHDLVCFLKDDWERVEWKKITKRENQLEGFIRRCSLGSERQRINLQTYYNAQPEGRSA